MNLGGGTHHAGRDFARGYCLFNDVAVALDAHARRGRARRALVVDCDVHQGDGTATCLARDPDCFTLSLHGARNYPSSGSLRPRRGPRERHRGRRLSQALGQALDHAVPLADAELAFYLAGADPWHGDRLGRLALTKEGLRARDELVLDRLRGGGRRGLRGARRRLRGGRARHGRHQRRDCPRCDQPFYARIWLPMTKR